MVIKGATFLPVKLDVRLCLVKKRTYQLKQRAERQAATRGRIVEATMALHTSVGPSKTTISGIAELAGVQRQTVYAHFPDEEVLFGACTSHWAMLYPFPDPATWESVKEPGRRLVAALTAIYGWYESVEDHLTLFRRDTAFIPPAIVAQQEERDRQLVAALAAAFPRRKLVRVAIAHALEFEIWKSLRHKDLSSSAAAELMTRLVTCVADNAAPRVKGEAADRSVPNPP
jgi:AcrR family transcriptional regulator